MNFILVVFVALASIVSASNLRTREVVPNTVNLVTATYHCPDTYKINQINENVGAIVDRINLRCTDPNFSQFRDIGTPIGYVTSPKAATIRLPAGAKGWNNIQVGYAYYAPKGMEVVAAVRFCAGSTCYESFFYGLTICSADDTTEYKCARIVKYDMTNTAKVFNGATTTFSPEKKYGHVVEFIPLFE